jgi:DNA repair protein RadC
MTVEYTAEEVDEILSRGYDGENAVPYPVEREKIIAVNARKQRRAMCSEDGEYAYLRVNVCVDYNYKRGDAKQIRITSSRSVDSFIRQAIPIEMSGVELFASIALDAKNQPTGIYIVHRGGISASVVDPVAVLQPAVALLASGLIVCHNHPSQSPEPSPEDLEITERLAQASRAVGIRLLDHLIVTQTGGYFSFLDANIMPKG